MATVPNYYLTETSTQSLVNFFAESTSVGLSEFYKAQHECTVARYALRDKTTVYTTLREFLQKQASSNPKEAFLLLGKLDIAADKMIQTVEKVVSLLKKAAEIDILCSTRFDGIQLYYIVQQIPTVIVTLIESVLEIQMDLFCEAILGDKYTKDVKDHIPVFAASVAKEIADKLALELQSKLKVVDAVDIVDAKIEPVEESRIAGMIDTVPLATGE